MTLSRRIWHIAQVFILLLLLLSARLVYWPLVRGQELQPVVLDPLAAAAQYRGESLDENSIDVTAPLVIDTLPQPVIQRTQAMLAGIQRGTIYDRNGRALAYDYPAGAETWARFYTEPSLAHTVGYVSGLRTGVTGIERSFNETLLGLNRFDTQVSRMVYQPLAGSDVYLTLDSSLQRTAAQALGGQTGAVVALDANTGAVLAMVSQPGFDPNRMLDQAYVNSLFAACPDPANCLNPLFNRAAQGSYVPGSTWKTVTLITALDNGYARPETVFDVGPPLESERGVYYVYRVEGGGVVVDPNHPEPVLDLTRAYVVSANAVFGRLGAEMPSGTLVAYANRLGFGLPGGEAPPLEIETSAAQLTDDLGRFAENNFLRATTGIGQGELLASPLSMALVVAAVVNEGNIPAPHLLQSVRHPAGRQLQAEPEGDWRPDVMRPETARQVRQMMITLVNESGLASTLPGFTAGGKTGTAETSGGRPPHAWFVGFAEGEERTVAIAVVVEYGGQGGQVAAPIFVQVAKAAVNQLGAPVSELLPLPTTR